MKELIEELIEESLKESQELAQKLVDVILESEKIYEDLINQRDNSKSYTLKNLLNTELWGYTSLTETMERYMQLLLYKIRENLESSNEYLNNAIKDIKAIENNKQVLEMLKIVKNSYNAQQAINNLWIITANMTLKNYPKIISRNFKDWCEFAKMLGSKISDVAADAIPGVSEWKNIYENIRDIAELVNKLEENTTNYSEVDKNLFEIEQHITLMNETENLFKESIKILEIQTDE